MPPKLPPGPSGTRLTGTLKWQRRPTAVMEDARQRYGEVWTLRLLGATNFVVVSEPDLLEGVFTADPEVLHTGVGAVGVPLMGERSVLLLNEREHTDMRGLLAPAFHGESVRRYRALTERISEQELARWPLHEPFPLLPRMETITLNVIMSAIFGVTEAPRQEPLRARVNAVVEWGGNPLRMAWLHGGQMRGRAIPRSFRRVRDPLDDEVFEVIARARKAPDLEQRDDVLAMLIRARREDGSPLTDRELRDQLVTLLVQGHASTADALCWAFERLMRHPDVYERLRDEIQAGEEDYLDAVIKETLRLRPPLPIASRLTKRPYTLGEHELEPDTLIAACIYLVHHREDLWPEHDRFRPERFLERPPDKNTWIPFGGGERGCLGAGFALSEIKAVLSTLVPRARLVPAEQRDEAIRRRRVGFSPSRGARAVLQERVPAASPANVAAS